ncbi:MAG: hypothetical protein J5819_03185 [Eubacterium sp.]|nr:hypothetical protein [Eubacterium sp.]
MINKKEEYFHFGTVKNMFWLMDRNNDIHIRYVATLDHEIDDEIIKKAWEKTKLVYPIIDTIIDVVDWDIYLYTANGENPVMHGERPAMPGSSVVGNRVVTLTVYKNKITMNAFHTLVDGGGLLQIMQTLLYTYLSEYTGETDGVTTVQLEENRDAGEYYRILGEGDLGEFEPQPLFLYPFKREFVEDEEMRPGDDGARIFGALQFDKGDFLKLCKANGANPSAMLCLWFAQAFYRLHPEERRDVGLAITISDRKTFGMEKYISNCLSMGILDISHEMAMMPETAAKIRRDISMQRTDDYIKTFWQFESTYGWNHIHRLGLVTYIGTVDIGSLTGHITDFRMETNSCNNLYLADMNDEFILMFQFGRVTREYMNEFKNLLTEAGISATVNTEPETVITDRDDRILEYVNSPI